MISLKKIFKIIFKIPDPFYFVGKFEKRPGLIKTFSILIKYFKTTKKINKIYILDIIKKLYSSIINILLIPFYLIFYLYLKKNKLTLICLNTWQVGALIQQLDSIIKNNLGNKYFLVCPKFLIEFNEFPYLYRKKNLKYSNNILLYCFVYPLLVFKEFSEDAFEFEALNIESKLNKLHVINKYKYNFSYFPKNIISGIDKRKIITIHFKDDLFASGKSIRVSKWKSYLETIKWLLSKNYTVIRFIHSNSVKNIYKHKNYFEFTTINEKEKIKQLFLIKLSKLFICTQSGPSSYNFILKTPHLQVNSFPINVSFVCSSKDFIIFKKIKKGKYYISLKEMIKKKFHLNFDIKNQKSNRYILEDNSSKEILNATKDILKKNKSYSFSNLLKIKKINIPAKDSKSKIPSSFYKKIIKD